MPRRGAATAAVAASSSADYSGYSGEDPVGVGSLLEFERQQRYLLGRAIKPTGQGWQVETAE